VHKNICDLSGVRNYEEPEKTVILPSKHPAPLDEIVDGYLHDTSFHNLLNLSVPLKLTHEDRFQQCHIVGGSGAGKTQLLQSLILHRFVTVS
jgi:chromosomal replication initiation ATPase DnaA